VRLRVAVLGISLLLLVSGCDLGEVRFLIWAENESSRDVRLVIEGSAGQPDAWFDVPANDSGWMDGPGGQLHGTIRVVRDDCVDVAVAAVGVPGVVIRVGPSGIVQSQDWAAAFGQSAGPSMSPTNRLAAASTCLLSSPPERTLPPPS